MKKADIISYLHDQAIVNYKLKNDKLVIQLSVAQSSIDNIDRGNNEDYLNVQLVFEGI